MNTDSTNTAVATRTFVAFACVAVVACGATACGSAQDSTVTPAAAAVPPSHQATHSTSPRSSSEDFVDQQKADRSAQWRRTAATQTRATEQHAQHQRPAGPARHHRDTRRDAIEEARNYAHIPAVGPVRR